MENIGNSEGLFRDGSEVKDVLASNIKDGVDGLYERPRISIEMISSFVNDALTEALINGFGGGEADAKLSVDEIEAFGLTFSDDAGYPRDHRELPDGEELPF